MSSENENTLYQNIVKKKSYKEEKKKQIAIHFLITSSYYAHPPKIHNQELIMNKHWVMEVYNLTHAYPKAPLTTVGGRDAR